MIRYDDEYRSMNAGALRRPASKVGAPALTWQRAFWRPTTDGQRVLVPVIDDEPWYKAIDCALLHIFLELRGGDRFECPHLERNGYLFLLAHKVLIRDGELELSRLDDDERSTRHDLFSLRTVRDGVRLSITARRHLEYFEILFSTEFCRDDRNVHSSPTVSTIGKLFEDLHDFAISRFEQSESTTKPHPDERQKAVLDASNLHLIQGYRSWIDDISSAAFSRNRVRCGALFLDCGTVFADFMGVIFSLRAVPGDEARIERAWPDGPGLGRSVTIPAQVRGELPDVLQSVEAIWPIIRGINRHRDLEERYGKPEYTVSLLQGGSAIYASSLGRLVPGNVEPEPLIYILAIPYASKYRLGRAVDRLHSLGLLRIAALQDLKGVQRASNNINAIYARISSYGGRTPTREELTELQEMFSTISGPDSRGQSINLGLTFRVDRSRYYVSSFKGLLEVMAPEPIKGFQVYSNFVRRRVYDAYDHIDRVGKRYDELQQHLIFLNAARQRSDLDSLQRNIADQVASTTKQSPPPTPS